MSHRVKVEIYDQPYTISGELEPEYVTRLARIVDERMREIASGSGTVDSVRVAVLAALAIADELESSRQDLRRRNRSVRERAERCLTLVERALRQSV
ncbi:MAG: cell division protein ZapA [Candidatus Acidiferrales bacterium]